MAQFILIRHGETEWNRNEKFRGRADLLLNDTGLKQAEAAALKLKDRGISAVYSSPLKRTLQTARPLANRFGLSVEPHEGLIDINYGDWQGLSPEEAMERDAILYDKWLKSPHVVHFPNGESLEIVRARVVGAVEELAEKHGDDTIAIVSHKVVCQVLLCAMFGLDNSHFWQVRQDVCAINAFEYKNGDTIVSLVNDICHLQNVS